MTCHERAALVASWVTKYGIHRTTGYRWLRSLRRGRFPHQGAFLDDADIAFFCAEAKRGGWA